jgi:hypothetical protein
VDSLTEFLAGTHVADVALAALVVEGALLAAQHARTGRGLGAVDLVSVLLPGAFLLLALRTALAGTRGPALCVFLLCALLAHLADVRRRWRQHDSLAPSARTPVRSRGRERLQIPE